MNFAPANTRAYVLPHETTWDQEKLNRLTSLLADGLSASKTAEALNEEFGTKYTRSAVLGKAHRAKLLVCSRDEHPGGRPFGSKNKHPHQRHDYTAGPELADASIPFAQRKTLFKLEMHDCRWPVGDPCSRDFFFCGGKALETAPYCAGHAKRAYGYVREAAKF